MPGKSILRSMASRGISVGTYHPDAEKYMRLRFELGRLHSFRHPDYTETWSTKRLNDEHNRLEKLKNPRSYEIYFKLELKRRLERIKEIQEEIKNLDQEALKKLNV